MTKRKRQLGVLDGVESNEPQKAKSTAARTKTKSSIKGNRAKNNALSSSKTTMMPRSQPNRIKAGLDFGTTASAFAFVMSMLDERDVEVNTEWPGGPSKNEHLEKVPSRFAFAEENKAVRMEEDGWGYDIPPGAKSYSWFKLMLDNADQTGYDSEELRGGLANGLLQLPEGVSADELVTAYLTKLYRHSMSMLEKRHTANIVKVTPIDWWFTVPATWQDQAILTTKCAAEEAGFASRLHDTLNIITEPEAAAIAILSRNADSNPDVVKDGHYVLICDLGGGTLDYQILKIVQVKPQLETEEAVPGIAIGHGSKFMAGWESAKTTFRGDLNKQYQIPLPALGHELQQRGESSAAYDKMDRCVLITGREIAELFQPVIENAFKLAEQQIAALKKSRKGAELQIICLCGGLGESTYVWKQFQAFCDSHFKNRCKLFTDKQAWSAVVRGAAIRGLNGNLVLSKKAKRCYGIGVHRPFREGIDREEDAYHCPFGGKRADGYVAWFMMLGRSIHPNMDIVTPLYETIEKHANDSTFEYTLYSCALEKPPERRDHPDVKEEASITIDLSEVTTKRSKEVDEVQDGHKKAEVKIVVRMGSNKGTLAVFGRYKRRIVGEAEINYAQASSRHWRPRAPGAL